ncbi:MAG TPA: MlaD family protein [Streptosporangiaceae bacterium]|nr:MlaD family protein [Streptosporangiaceae bacterium]
MLTLSTKIKLVTFAVLAVVVLAFTAVRYANLGRFIGLSGYYTVKMYLPESGGLYNDANVTYRGVSVGRVGSMSLTSNGVVVDLDINNSAPKIPATGLQATVADLSAVGENYVNLRPQTSSGPYLTAGSVIPQHVTQVPLPVTSLLTSLNALVSSVPQQSLRVVVDQLGTAFQGQGPNLQVLLDTSSTLTQAASKDIPQTTKLIDDGRTVLATQAAETAAIRSFGASARNLASHLAASNGDLVNLLISGPQAAEQIAGLLRDNSIGLGAVIANLLTVSDVTLTKQSNLDEMLSALPAAVAAGNTVITSKGANFGLSLTFFAPLPCTSGYGGTIYRNGLNTSAAPPLNTSAACTSPVSSGIDVRGAAHAPSSGGVPAAVLPGSAGGGAGAGGMPVASGAASMSELLGLTP